MVRDHIFVHVPVVDAEVEDVAKALLSYGTPSEAATYAKMLQRQVRNNPGAIWNGRPLELPESPINIFNPANVSILRCCSTPLEDFNFSREELKNASALVSASRARYMTKEERAAAFQASFINATGSPTVLQKSPLALTYSGVQRIFDPTESSSLQSSPKLCFS